MEAQPFTFALERVRQVRANDEERAKEAFAQSLAARARGAAMLQAATDAIEQAHDQGRVGTVLTQSGQDLVSMHAYLERLERDRQQAALDLDRAEAEAEARRQALLAASQRREALDRLRARRESEHRQRAARAEGARLDEIALITHQRNAL